MRALIRTIELITRACGYVASLLVLVLIWLMVYEVIMRYVFDAPTLWSYDVSTMTMGAIFVLSIGYTLLTDTHVRIDLLHPYFGRRAKPAIDLIGHGLVMLPLVVWLASGLWEHFYDGWTTLERTGASAWNPLVWPFRAVMFVAAVVWALQLVAEILKALLELADNTVVEPDRPIPLE